MYSHHRDTRLLGILDVCPVYIKGEKHLPSGSAAPSVRSPARKKDMDLRVDSEESVDERGI